MVRIKNRFTSPQVNGYQDIQLIVRLVVKNQLGHLVSFICEVCVTHHLVAKFKITNKRSNEIDEYFKSLLMQSTSLEKQEAICDHLQGLVDEVEECEKQQEDVKYIDVVYRVASRYYEESLNECNDSTHYLDQDLDFVLENWVDILTFFELYEEAEKFQKMVVKIVIQISGDEENVDVAEALDTHAKLLKLQVNTSIV